MGFEKQLQFVYKGFQFLQALRRCLQALLLPYEPAFSFFGDADGQIPFEEDTGLTKQTESVVGDWVEEGCANSLPDADCVCV